MKIYPDIEIHEATVIGSVLLPPKDVVRKHIRLSTNIRKKYRGKWYTTLVANEYVNTPIDISFNLFIKSVYNYQMLGHVTLNTVDVYGRDIFELDSDQRDELERLKSKIIT